MRQPTAAVTLTMSAELLEAVAVRAAELVAEQLQASRPEAYIGVDAAADYIAAPKSRVYALVSAGRIPHRKDGSRLLFRPSELDAWLDQGGGIRP